MIHSDQYATKNCQKMNDFFPYLLKFDEDRSILHNIQEIIIWPLARLKANP